jgi:hypothetical protein
VATSEAALDDIRGGFFVELTVGSNNEKKSLTSWAGSDKLNWFSVKKGWWDAPFQFPNCIFPFNLLYTIIIFGDRPGRLVLRG